MEDMQVNLGPLVNFPDVTVLICTYNRPNEIAETVEALTANLSYPADKLHWLICDDHSPDGYITKLKRARVFKGLNAQFVVTSQNGGWGVNNNNGLRAVTTECTFFLEDDYVLKHPLDLRIGAALLEARSDIGMLRYRGTAGTHLVMHQLEADVSPWLPDYQDGCGLPGKLAYLQIDSGSPSTYIYSNGPHLKRRSFHDFYGAYPERFLLGATEELMANQVKRRMIKDGAPGIAILPEWIPMRFAHIGKSYQGTEVDGPWSETHLAV